MSTILSKFQGSLVGAVIGDCIGSIFESRWLRTISIDEVIKAIEEIEAEAEKETDYKIWEFTDDTAMTRSVAKSLIKCKGFNAEDMAERFAENYFSEPDRGYGGNIITVFEQLQKSNYQDVFRPAKKQFNGLGSYGNGGAMRIAPAALFTYQDNDPEHSKELVTKITQLTHTHPQGILGAILQSFAVDMALNSSDTFSPDEMVDALITLMRMTEEEPKKEGQGDGKQTSDNVMEHMEEDGRTKCSTYVEKLELIKSYLNRKEQPDRLTVHDELGVDVSAFHSVPAAVYSFLTSNKDIAGLENRNTFEKTVIYAISLGGDSDTVASMAGAIAGACYGLEYIPKSWQKCCEGVDDAKKFAEGLFKLQSGS